MAALCFMLFGCNSQQETCQIVATTLPVYEFSKILCEGTDLEVFQLITQDIACLHNYTLQVPQMQAIERAELLIISGAGLEDFLKDISTNSLKLIDASENIPLNCMDQHHSHEGDHNHDVDPHYWLSPENAKIMVKNICNSLTEIYPEYADVIANNAKKLEIELTKLSDYGSDKLSNLSCHKLITFHDGFGYMAEAFQLEIVHAIEEESGSEASASELIDLIQIVDEYTLPAVFTERNGSASSASILKTECNIPIYDLDMAMSGESYFSAMYHNIDILSEALK